MEQRENRELGTPAHLVHRDMFGRINRADLRGPIIVGRSEGCGLVIRDPVVSSFHFAVFPSSPAVWFVADLGSRNGTFLVANGPDSPGNQSLQHIVQPVRLTHGDRIRFGRTHSVVVFLDDTTHTDGVEAHTT
jgi:pSer/pThr/pTyr-binding forkhead associated (FHA) protein